MGSETIAHEIWPNAESVVDSEAMRARGIIPLVKLVGQKYRDKTILASKTRFSRHCFGFNSRRFSPRVGYNIWPSSSSTNQEAALIIDH